MYFDAQCAARLKEERERLGLSQQEIADQISVRREMWSKYERAQAVPGGDALAAFSQVGGDLSYVIHGWEKVSITDEDERALLIGYRKLDVRGKAGVLSLIGGMKPDAPSTVFHGSVGQVVQGDQRPRGPITFTVEGSNKKKS